MADLTAHIRRGLHFPLDLPLPDGGLHPLWFHLGLDMIGALDTPGTMLQIVKDQQVPGGHPREGSHHCHPHLPVVDMMKSWTEGLQKAGCRHQQSVAGMVLLWRLIEGQGLTQVVVMLKSQWPGAAHLVRSGQSSSETCLLMTGHGFHHLTDLLDGGPPRLGPISPTITGQISPEMSHHRHGGGKMSTGRINRARKNHQGQDMSRRAGSEVLPLVVNKTTAGPMAKYPEGPHTRAELSVQVVRHWLR